MSEKKKKLPGIRLSQSRFLNELVRIFVKEWSSNITLRDY